MAWCIEVISLCPSLCQWSLLFVWSFDLMIPGFARENALNACCGYGGKYNYNLLVLCGRTGAVVDPVTLETAIVNISESCPNPNEYIVWDGIHGTEAFYRIITTFFLTGRFVSGPPGFSNLVDTCGLDTSNFWQPAWGTSIKSNQTKSNQIITPPLYVMRVIDIRLSSIHNMHWMSEFVHLIDSEYYISVTLQIVMDVGSCLQDCSLLSMLQA